MTVENDQGSLFTQKGGLPSRQEFERAIDGLSSEDRERFAAELVQAAYDSFSGDTSDPVVSTVRAWYKSALFMGQPDFHEKLSRSLDDLKSLEANTS
jgi:hypothetical protein